MGSTSGPSVHHLTSTTTGGVLPHLVSLTEADFLEDFAQNVHADPNFPASNDKTIVISSLLAAAVSKATLFPPPKPSGCFCYSVAPRMPSDESAAAKLYIQAAYGLHCEEIVGAILDRVTNTNGLTADAALACTKNVMLPLTAFFIGCA